ncbi:MAG: hypothetical protein QF893_14690 [Alphaproteobacteria bacterium]|nr:hypothetical protein [Alphaproteobacteria bacterium]
MPPVEIDRHIFQTYRTLRLGIAGLAISFPTLLIVLGWIYGVEGVGNSWSAYYHHSPVTRDVFVGVLWAIGIFFILYKGYSKKENIGLNIGGFFAICVAMFPMNLYDADVKGVIDSCEKGQVLESYAKDHGHNFVKDEEVMIGQNSVTGKQEYANCSTGVHVHVPGFEKLVISLHGLSALIFFLSAAFVAIFTSSATLHKLGKPRVEAFLKNFYQGAGALMFLLPLGLFGASAFIERLEPTLIFSIETVGLTAFVLYWVVKTAELMYISDDLILDDLDLLTAMGVRSRR